MAKWGLNQRGTKITRRSNFKSNALMQERLVSTKKLPSLTLKPTEANV